MSATIVVRGLSDLKTINREYKPEFQPPYRPEPVRTEKSVNNPTLCVGMRLKPADDFNFVSSGTIYTGQSCTANATYTAKWTIEGSPIPGLAAGTVTLKGDKTVKFSIAPQANLTRFDCNTNSLTGNLPSLDNFTALQYFYCNGNALTGTVPRLTQNTAIIGFYCGDNNLVGSIPSLASNTALADFRCNANVGMNGIIPTLSATVMQTFAVQGCAFSDVAPGFAVPASLTYGRFDYNALPQTAVDAILAAFVTAGASGAYTLNLVGNAVPSAAGATSKSTLTGRGWTVTTS